MTQHQPPEQLKGFENLSPGTYNTPGGSILSYSHTPAAQHKPGAPILVLLHGWPQTRYIWRYAVPMLVEMGHTLFVPDLPGYGYSTMSTAAASGVGAKSAHDRRAMERARESQNLNQVLALVVPGVAVQRAYDHRSYGAIVSAVRSWPQPRAAMRPGGVRGLEVPLRVAEGAELDRYARADAQQRRQRALVEGQRALLGVDGRGGVEGGAVLRRGLQTHLDDVEGLACAGRFRGRLTDQDLCNSPMAPAKRSFAVSTNLCVDILRCVRHCPAPHSRSRSLLADPEDTEAASIGGGTGLDTESREDQSIGGLAIYRRAMAAEDSQNVADIGVNQLQSGGRDKKSMGRGIAPLSRQ
ncbi:hypothetical protein NUW58_g9364 [Xylaria curta]|uniref:Uncharacterized protein n=1 Tax=Xylaria curta TaxID=42375 RepID=A0ACC1MX91_9PEZI|nr:hypothetical protein NUW58_g9364 [Xylaria curta]